MPLRNGEHGYGVVTKSLHWLTVAAITGQFAVGLTMEADDAAFDREDDRIDQLEDSGEEVAKRQGQAAEERFDDEIDRLEDQLKAREDDYVPPSTNPGFRYRKSMWFLGFRSCCWECCGCCGAPPPRCRRGPIISAPVSADSRRGWRRYC